MSDPKAALRDLLDGRIRGYDRRLSRFTEPDWQRYADLLAGVFLLAVRRRFRPGQDRAPIIRFVATVRERYDHTGHDLDPAIAETLVWAALGETDPIPVTGPAVTAQTLLVLGLLEDEGMPHAELDEFLTAADALARPSGSTEAGADTEPAGPVEVQAGPVEVDEPETTPEAEREAAAG